jgi:GNAT superfamily N-acetyltransferase
VSTEKLPTMLISDAPDRADYEIILKGLADFEEAAVGPLDFKPLAILIKDEAGLTIGGLWGKSLFRWLIIELVFVPERFRHSGLGTQIMTEAESIAKARGCLGIWLDTYSFQAPRFYEKLGFRMFGRLDDQPPGEQRFFMQKRFDAEPGLKA